MYLCEKCNKRRRSTKQLNILRYPKVLVIHLNRFRFNSLFREKLSTDVLFPASGLNISPYLVPNNIEMNMDAEDPVTAANINVESDPSLNSPITPISPSNLEEGTNASNQVLYDLAGISHHSGSMQGGHYIAHVNTKTHGDQRWMCFNDTRVSHISSNCIGGPSAYVLFYTLRQCDQGQRIGEI